MSQTSSLSQLIDPEAQSDLIDVLGPEIFEAMVQSLARGLRSRLAEIDQAILASDQDGLVRAAHDIRGSALNLGFIAIGQAARGLELSASYGQTVDEARETLHQAIEHSRAEIPALRTP